MRLSVYVTLVHSSALTLKRIELVSGMRITTGNSYFDGIGTKTETSPKEVGVGLTRLTEIGGVDNDVCSQHLAVSMRVAR